MYTILLIEDEKTLSDNVAEMLRMKGYICQTATDGRAAIAVINKITPDVIICDIMMPNMNGMELKAELNKQEKHKYIPFIFLTAKSEREDNRAGMNLGADDFITKPFKINELLVAVERLIEKGKAMKEQVNKGVSTLFDDFVKIAPHEVNTPLSAILLLSDGLNTENDRTKIKEAAVLINKSGKRLLKTINNMISVAEHSKKQLFEKATSTNINLTDIVKKQVALLSAKYSLEESIVFKGDNVEINYAMEQDFEAVVIELVDNAIKFAKPGTKVRLLLNKDLSNQYFMFKVTNRSASRSQMPKAVQDIGAFTQFNRGYNEQQGTGLGLYHVSQVCQKNNWVLNIERKSPTSISFTVVGQANLEAQENEQGRLG